MSPIDYIAEGIRQGNWETVCEGYKRLTGQSLPFPEISAVTNNMTERIEYLTRRGDALQQIADIAFLALNDPIAEICNTTVEPPKRKPGRPKGNSKKKGVTVTKSGKDSSLQLNDTNRTVVQKNIGTTQLITNDPDPKEVAENIERAKRAGKNKLKLNRRVATTYTVKCNECEKSFESSRKQGEMGQKCPTCLKGLKGRVA